MSDSEEKRNSSMLNKFYEDKPDTEESRHEESRLNNSGKPILSGIEPGDDYFTEPHQHNVIPIKTQEPPPFSTLPEHRTILPPINNKRVAPVNVNPGGIELSENIALHKDKFTSDCREQENFAPIEKELEATGDKFKLPS